LVAAVGEASRRASRARSCFFCASFALAASIQERFELAALLGCPSEGSTLALLVLQSRRDRIEL
jgi:hypothetical protein